MKRKDPDPGGADAAGKEEGGEEGVAPRPVSEIPYLYPRKIGGTADMANIHDETTFIEYTWERCASPFEIPENPAPPHIGSEKFERQAAPCAVRYAGFMCNSDVLDHDLPLTIGALRRQPWLVKLTLSWCGISDGALADLVGLLRASPNIQSLDIHRCRAARNCNPPLDWGRFVDYVQDATELRKLAWVSNAIPYSMLMRLFCAIARNRSIIHLELTATTDEPETLISGLMRSDWVNAMLRENRTLQHITIGSSILAPHIQRIFEGSLYHHASIKSARFVCTHLEHWGSEYETAHMIAAAAESHLQYVHLEKVGTVDAEIRQYVDKVLAARTATYSQTREAAALVHNMHRVCDDGPLLDILPHEIIHLILSHLAADLKPPLNIHLS